VHGKGSFPVLDIMAHGIVSMHGKGVRLCRASFLCRALVSLFVVRPVFVVRSVAALQCVSLCRAFGGMFAVRFLFAVHYCFVTRQSHLYRATAHAIVKVHGSLCLSASE
jgi:hypothetical protein